jgi:hypothetical protein
VAIDSELLQRDQLVAGGHHPNTHTPMDQHLLRANGRQQTDARGGEPRARVEDRLAHVHVLTRGTHIAAGITRVAHQHAAGVAGGVFDAHHRVGANGHGSTRRDAHGLAGPDLARGLFSRPHVADHAQ